MQLPPMSKIADGVYQIKVPMPHFNPPSINAYLIKGEAHSLLIDTGVDLDLCVGLLHNALTELGVTMDTLDILITHSHGDHTGMLHRFAAPETKVYMNEFLRDYDGSYREYIDQLSKTVGINYYTTGCNEITPEEVYPPLIKLVSSLPIGGEHIYCKDGDVMHYGDRELIYLTTPGHCEDHCALYSPHDGMLFSGDLILNKTYPAISDFRFGDNHLSVYFESLRKIDALNAQKVCPGHGAGFDINTRLEQTRQHHFNRTCYTADMLQKDELTIDQLARKVNRKYHGKCWEQLTPTQKFTALAENLAYIALLQEYGIVHSREWDDEVLHYSCIEYDPQTLCELIF